MNIERKVSESRGQSQLILLDLLRKQMDEDVPILRINAPMQLTKSGAMTLCRLRLQSLPELRERVHRRLAGGLGMGEIVGQYARHYGTTLSETYPSHYPVRILGSVGPAASGHNIFMFFPYAAGIESADPRHQFGLEFVNVWAQVFEKIVVPAARIVFDTKTQESIQQRMTRGAEEVSALCSVLHEIGHRVGPFRVSPATDKKMHLQPGTSLVFDACGELTTDSLMVTLFPEFPEVSAFVLLARLLYFPRKGYVQSGGANMSTDNDALLGPLFWRLGRSHGVIVPNGHVFHVDFDQVPTLFAEALKVADEIGSAMLVADDIHEQERLASQWLREQLDWIPGAPFPMPTELSNLYERLQVVPEHDFVPPVVVDGLAV